MHRIVRVASNFQCRPNRNIECPSAVFHHLPNRFRQLLELLPSNSIPVIPQLPRQQSITKVKQPNSKQLRRPQLLICGEEVRIRLVIHLVGDPQGRQLVNEGLEESYDGAGGAVWEEDCGEVELFVGVEGETRCADVGEGGRHGLVEVNRFPPGVVRYLV